MKYLIIILLFLTTAFAEAKVLGYKHGYILGYTLNATVLIDHGRVLRVLPTSGNYTANDLRFLEGYRIGSLKQWCTQNGLQLYWVK